MKIVMYHYVRDYKNTRYPYIKGLDVRDFEFQIPVFFFDRDDLKDALAVLVFFSRACR